MRKFKYLFCRIIELNYSNMMVIAKKISNRTKKPFIFIVLDMIICGLKYQAGYYDYQEFEFYNMNKAQRKTYLTRGKNNEIIRKFNDISKFPVFEKKDEFNVCFQEFIRRDWMKLTGNNLNEFVNFIEKHSTIIVKPIDGEGGEGVAKVEFTNRLAAEELYNKFINNNQCLVEECIQQNEAFNMLYGGSVNSLRVYSFYKDGQVHILQVILKIGNGGVVDNFSGGGMYTFVDDEGCVFVGAIDKEDNIFFKHPITNAEIIGFKVPLFDKVKEVVIGAAKVIPEIAYVGWDVAVGRDDALIIEGNCFPGVFQVKPSLHPKKEGVIPKYDKVMNIFNYS